MQSRILSAKCLVKLSYKAILCKQDVKFIASLTMQRHFYSKNSVLHFNLACFSRFYLIFKTTDQRTHLEGISLGSNWDVVVCVAFVQVSLLYLV